jgi:ParB family chromosome partitioning protein
MTKARGLGRGLSALIGENLVELNNDGLSHIALENISPNKNQPRMIFNPNELEELASSIRQNGILQPILVRQLESEEYQIIAGERRWRAAKIAGLATIPAIVKEMHERDVLEIALVENIQRENLSPLEEAEGYRRLIDECQYTQEKMAEIVSKSRSHITNLLRLLNLPDKIKQYLHDGAISLGHAKLLVNQKESEQIVKLIVENNLNVRETEDLVREQNGFQTSSRGANFNKQKSLPKDSDNVALEVALGEALGMPVIIDHFMKGGRISINFHNLQQLDALVQKLSKSIA